MVEILESAANVGSHYMSLPQYEVCLPEKWQHHEELR